MPCYGNATLVCTNVNTNSRCRALIHCLCLFELWAEPEPVCAFAELGAVAAGTAGIGGGGGRIAIYADTDTFSGTIQALGGSGYEYGESGTTYLESPLIVGFTAAPQSGTAPLTVTFTNTTTGDVSAYEWAFGDGSTSVITHPTHVYTTTGVYTVSLTATGPGISDRLTRTNYITVTSAAGEPVTITRVITYTYDPLNRLTEADYSTDEQFEYAYDEVGNRTVMTATQGAASTTGVITYTYDAANRLTSVGDVSYTWDDRGNLVSDGTFTYTYNAAGRMVQAESVTVTLVYTYNAQGLRVAQSVNGVETPFVWDWASGIPEMLSDGTNLYLVGHETLGQWDSATWAYYLPDALSSIRQTTDDTGAVASGREWTPFGTEISTVQTGLGYTGEWWDGSAGLLYLRARWYQPETGRFLTRDLLIDFVGPLQMQHSYAYVNNNSVNLTDPSGYVPEPPHPIPYPYDVTSFEIGWDWLTEQCPELLVFNERYDLTQSLMRDEGVNQARAQFYRKWREGTLTDGTNDYYPHQYLVIPYIREAIQYLTGSDRIGFFLGSYGVSTHLEGKTVAFTVKDPKNWESAGRNPFYWVPELIMEPHINPYLPDPLKVEASKNTLEDIIRDPNRFKFPSDIFLAGLLFARRERGDPGFFGSDIRLGGDITIVFTWTEPLKIIDICSRK